MKSVLVAPALAAAFVAGGACAACEGVPSSAQLKIVVDNVRSAKGQVTSTLYANDDGKFLKSNGSLKVWRTAAVSPATTMCIWLPGPGEYAVASYHDENSNGKWDHSRLGAIEGFGFSRNPTIFFSPPRLSASRFKAGEGETTIHIHLSYR